MQELSVAMPLVWLLLQDTVLVYRLLASPSPDPGFSLRELAVNRRDGSTLCSGLGLRVMVDGTEARFARD